MATSAKIDYDSLAANPQVRGFLDRIANAEGTAGRGQDGYNIGFGGGQFDGYAAHPNVRNNFTQTDGKGNVTTAAGRYQMINSTWNDTAKKLGLKDFSPANQDKAAIELIRQNGALDNVLTGDYTGAVNKLGGVWASLPSSSAPQRHVSMEQFTGQPGSDTMPTQIVNRGGVPNVAIPENDTERELMNGFHTAGHDDATQSALTAATGMITKADQQLADAGSLFISYPNDLDGHLLDLIDRA